MRGQPEGAIPSLDGIRALAVALVFLAHSGLEHLVPGGLGVTIFFVLSGFLITTLMVQEHARTGGVSFRLFYLRRLVRLMPPLLVVVALAALLSSLGAIDGAFSGQGLAAVLLYFGNYHMIATDFDGVPLGIGVFWSLAVEEHFYLLYPPLALLLLRLRRRSAAFWPLAGAMVAVLAWRGVLYATGTHSGADPAALERWIGMATDTRIDAILAGCIMGLLWNPWIAPPAARPWRDRALLGLGLGVLAGSLLWRDEAFRLTARYTLQSLAIAPLIWLAVARPDALAGRWLNAAPVAWLGKVSYAVYLSHQVILYGLQKWFPAETLTGAWLLRTLAALALTLLLAEAIRRLVEEPCAVLRRRLQGHIAPDLRKPALAGAAGVP